MDELERVLIDERRKEVEDRRKSLLNCQVSSISEGFVFLECDRAPSFEEGDEIGYSDSSGPIPLGMVVSKVEKSLTISSENTVGLAQGDELELLELEPLISYDLQLGLIDRIKKGEISPDREPVLSFVRDKHDIARITKRTHLTNRRSVDGEFDLDDSQVEAVEFSLSLNDGEFLLIVGPPGTGKTEVIKKIASELIKRHETVLISSHTNYSVNQAIDGLPPESALRVCSARSLGKIQPRLEKYLLSYRARQEAGRLYEELRVRISDLQQERRKLTDNQRLARSEAHHRQMDDLRALELEINRLKTERDGLLKKQQEALVREIPIIGATLIKSQLNPLRNVSFNTVIVDEASQATVTLALLAMLHGKKWIVVGDHRQLLPIFRSLPKPQSEKETVAQEELKNRFGAFTNLYYKYGNERGQWLQWHHRSNDKIIEFAKKYVYEKEIKTVDSCHNIKLKAKGWDVLSKGELLDPDKPVIFIHREGHDMRDGESRYNIEEVETCVELVNMLIKCGISQEEIGVITPYGAQSKELRNSIHDRYRRVDVSTVDAFQGNEKDAIIFSLTATSDLKFASNINRLNVALTRPRCKLVVVANGKSIDSEDKNLLIHHFLEYANDEKAVFYWDKEMWRANIPKEQVPICIKNGWSICKELDKSTTLIERSIAHFQTKATSDSQGHIPKKETDEYRPDISTNIVNLREQGKVNGYLKTHPNATDIEIAIATDMPVRVVTAILASIAQK